MAARHFGWTAALLIELSSAVVIRAQSTPRMDGWRLAQDSIQDSIKESGTRKGIPRFIAWATTREIFPCSDHKNPYARVASLRNILDESFHYSPATATRLCEPLIPGKGTGPLDAAQALWEKLEPKPPATAFQFPDGAHLGAAFWNALRMPAVQNGKIVPMPVRSGNEVRIRRIRITVPARLRGTPEGCVPPGNPGDPARADTPDVSLEEFFWVRLGLGERYSGSFCGDFAVLMAFHLVHRVHGRWLWTTFWWDPESKEFGADRPRNFQGAGDLPSAWRNYAMDAAFETTATIFNPWRIEERKDNCARCHAEVTVYNSPASNARISFDSVTAARNHFQ